MVQCKAVNKGNKQPCKKGAVIDGYCVKHYELYVNSKLPKKKDVNWWVTPTQDMKQKSI